MKALFAMLVLLLSVAVQAAPATCPPGLSSGGLAGAGADILPARLPDAQCIDVITTPDAKPAVSLYRVARLRAHPCPPRDQIDPTNRLQWFS
ncbi:MAG TPA: hypothetical protein VFJ87_00665 [Rhodanobacteraceae bacterium]|jgi:hypothetical protein|nr:hypothetical protein [Rhodanobacteraceae bacterium]